MITPLPKNPLASLADEVMLALPCLLVEYPNGPSLRCIAAHLAADYTSVRTAAKELNHSARGDLMKRRSSRELFLVPLKYREADGIPHCSHCGNLFDRPTKTSGRSGKKRYTHYNDRRCCTRSCAVAWSWTRGAAKEKRSAGIKKTHSTPEALARTAAHNKRRWSKPGERDRMSEQNRQQWANPIKKATRSQQIRENHRKPEMRKKFSEIIKRLWSEPDYRAKTVDGIRRSKSTPEARAKFSKLLRDRWADPTGRLIYLAGVRKTARKMSARNKGKKQQLEQIAKRVASTRATRTRRAQEGARA